MRIQLSNLYEIMLHMFLVMRHIKLKTEEIKVLL